MADVSLCNNYYLEKAWSTILNPLLLQHLFLTHFRCEHNFLRPHNTTSHWCCDVRQKPFERGVVTLFQTIITLKTLFSSQASFLPCWSYFLGEILTKNLENFENILRKFYEVLKKCSKNWRRLRKNLVTTLHRSSSVVKFQLPKSCFRPARTGNVYIASISDEFLTQ